MHTNVCMWVRKKNLPLRNAHLNMLHLPCACCSVSVLFLTSAILYDAISSLYCVDVALVRGMLFRHMLFWRCAFLMQLFLVACCSGTFPMRLAEASARVFSQVPNHWCDHTAAAVVFFSVCHRLPRELFWGRLVVSPNATFPRTRNRSFRTCDTIDAHHCVHHRVTLYRRKITLTRCAWIIVIFLKEPGQQPLAKYDITLVVRQGSSTASTRRKCCGLILKKESVFLLSENLWAFRWPSKSYKRSSNTFLPPSCS